MNTWRSWEWEGEDGRGVIDVWLVAVIRSNGDDQRIFEREGEDREECSKSPWFEDCGLMKRRR